ncbi:MAG: hypothetical protein ACK4IS_12795 [Erythrobacter sp.]
MRGDAPLKRPARASDGKDKVAVPAPVRPVGEGCQAQEANRFQSEIILHSALEPDDFRNAPALAQAKMSANAEAKANLGKRHVDDPNANSAEVTLKMDFRRAFSAA